MVLVLLQWFCKIWFVFHLLLAGSRVRMKVAFYILLLIRFLYQGRWDFNIWTKLPVSFLVKCNSL